MEMSGKCNLEAVSEIIHVKSRREYPQNEEATAKRYLETWKAKKEDHYIPEEKGSPEHPVQGQSVSAQH